MLTQVGNTTGSDDSVEYPGGTLAGHLLVMVITAGHYDGGDWIDLELAGPDNAYTRVADGTTTPLTIAFDSTGGLSFLNNGWTMVAFSDFIGYGPAPPPTPADQGPSPAHPPVPPNPQRAAVMVVSSSNGTVAGHPGLDVDGNWVSEQFNQRGRRAATVYSWNSDAYPLKEPVPVANLPITGTDAVWQSVAFAVNTGVLSRPVTRQYPRDTLGLAAAPRVVPPTRTNRVVGGHH